MMLRSSTATFIIRYCFLDIIGSFLYWPLWWYSRGLILVLSYLWSRIRAVADGLSLRLMFATLLQPMYGQNDREGRMISFFMRLVLLISRILVLVVVSLWWLCVLCLWIIVPLVIIIRLASFFV
jgi:hypothetical protein